MSDLVPRSSAVARAFVSPPVTRHRYNKRQSDFSALKEYNDYLEETEEIIFNLCEGVETRATETKVEAYRRENAADIARRQQRNAEEEQKIQQRMKQYLFQQYNHLICLEVIHHPLIPSQSRPFDLYKIHCTILP